jgi:hypothetical protein
MCAALAPSVRGRRAGERMNLRRYRIGLLWLAIQLLLGQQLAFAHMIGHVGDVAHGSALNSLVHVDDDDEEHTPAHALSHLCTVCVGVAGLDIAPARAMPLPAVSGNSFSCVVTAVSPAPTLARYPPFFGRAPPGFPKLISA